MNESCFAAQSNRFRICDLVRKRLDDGLMYRQHWIEQISEPHTLGLGYQSKQRTIAIEAPGSSLIH
jgi:hypothetical protein